MTTKGERGCVARNGATRLFQDSGESESNLEEMVKFLRKSAETVKPRLAGENFSYGPNLRPSLP